MPTTCAFCALPLPADPTSAEPRYCCFGCRFAAEVTRASGEQGAVNGALIRLILAAFFTMNVMVFTMALWSHDVYGDVSASTSTATLSGLFRYLCLLFALPVLFLLGRPLLENSLASWKAGRPSTDGLLLAGVAASYLYSAHSVLREEGPIYFEVGCVVLLLVTLGRWLEAHGKLRAGAALDALEKLLPDDVRLVGPTGETTCPRLHASVGCELRVLAGERIPCDGVVLYHPVEVDEQILTGESARQVREPGDSVWAGTLNLDSTLHVRVSAPPDAGALDRLLDLVRAARARKGHYQLRADRLAGWFLPLVLTVALGTFVAHGFTRGWHDGILAALAVILIACPCALGIATPLAVWLALGEAARRQVIFQSGEVLERLAGIRAVAFDKTGTLTTGSPSLAELVADDDDSRPALLAKARTLADSSTHALCRAIAASPAAAAVMAPGDARPRLATLPGRGIMAELEDGPAFLGSARLMREQQLEMGDDLRSILADAQKRALTFACLGWAGAVRGIFLFREQLRPEARAALLQLRSLGLHVEILTGDHAARGLVLAQELAVPVQADLLPADKLARIAALRKTFGPVAMVGDGINDSPALAGSDVGIALGCGADVARASAGVCLLGNDLTRVAWTIHLARRTVHSIRRNLFWTFAYNVVGIALAAAGLLNPVLAALAMVLSSAFVVGGCLRFSFAASTRAP